ncbi:MAG TPA: hypothetical protein VJM49_05310, partial [Acidimicrobiales bacterium]|nr:hypothetical protein [Acidimicrobiales bacterium]
MGTREAENPNKGENMATHSADLGAGVGRADRRVVGRRTFTETKLGIKTTEFLLTIAMIVALVVAVYVGDADLDAADGWK